MGKCGVFSADARLEDIPPKRQTIFPQFSDKLFYCHPQQRPILDITLQEIHLYAPLYLVLSYFALPVHRHIKHFTSNRTILGPFQVPFTPPPVSPSRSRGGSGVVCAASGWFALHECNFSRIQITSSEFLLMINNWFPTCSSQTKNACSYIAVLGRLAMMTCNTARKLRNLPQTAAERCRNLQVILVVKILWL